MNWFPVEYEGTLSWADHMVLNDNDYTWDILRDDLALVTKDREQRGVHVEFDSRETVDEWDGTNTWWENFHHNVVDNDKYDKTAIRSWFGSRFAIVIGMLGLDVYHGDHHSELHPAYAMFIRLPGQRVTSQRVTSNVRWTFFVRNWGNEGFCGPDDEPIPNRQIRVRIPDQTLLAWNGWVYAHDGASVDECFSQSQVTLQPITDGTLLIFDLPPASKKCGFVGDLTMKGSSLVIGGGSASSFAAATVGASDEDEHEDPVLRARVAKLTPSGRKELDKRLSNLMSIPRSGATVPIAPTLTDYSKDLKAVPSPAWQAEQEKKRRFIDAFLKAHGID